MSHASPAANSSSPSSSSSSSSSSASSASPSSASSSSPSTASLSPYEFSDGVVPSWLHYWYNAPSPSEVSCLLAIDTLFHCLSPAHQFRALYRSGTLGNCDQAISDVPLCFKVRGLAVNDPAKAARKLVERQEMLRKEHEEATLNQYGPPVWHRRKVSLRDIDNNSSSSSPSGTTVSADSTAAKH